MSCSGSIPFAFFTNRQCSSVVNRNGSPVARSHSSESRFDSARRRAISARWWFSTQATNRFLSEFNMMCPCGQKTQPMRKQRLRRDLRTTRNDYLGRGPSPAAIALVSWVTDPDDTCHALLSAEKTSRQRAVSCGVRPHPRTIIKSQYPQRTISPLCAKGPRIRR